MLSVHLRDSQWGSNVTITSVESALQRAQWVDQCDHHLPSSALQYTQHACVGLRGTLRCCPYSCFSLLAGLYLSAYCELLTRKDSSLHLHGQLAPAMGRGAGRVCG